jgi:hypothetical protein
LDAAGGESAAAVITARGRRPFAHSLTRHVPLLSALRSWRLRLLFPPALSDARDAYLRTVHQVLEPVVSDGAETRVELVPVTQSYLRLERLVGTA